MGWGVGKGGGVCVCGGGGGGGSAQELCQIRGGRPRLPVLMSLMVSVDVKQH